MEAQVRGIVGTLSEQRDDDADKAESVDRKGKNLVVMHLFHAEFGGVVVRTDRGNRRRYGRRLLTRLLLIGLDLLLSLRSRIQRCTAVGTEHRVVSQIRVTLWAGFHINFSFFIYKYYSIRQTEWAEMPSNLPVKPSFSSVVALTLT